MDTSHWGYIYYLPVCLSLVVMYRVFSLDPALQPVESGISVEIMVSVRVERLLYTRVYGHGLVCLCVCAYVCVCMCVFISIHMCYNVPCTHKDTYDSRNAQFLISSVRFM